MPDDDEEAGAGGEGLHRVLSSLAQLQATLFEQHSQEVASLFEERDALRLEVESLSSSGGAKEAKGVKGARQESSIRRPLAKASRKMTLPRTLGPRDSQRTLEKTLHEVLALQRGWLPTLQEGRPSEELASPRVADADVSSPPPTPPKVEADDEAAAGDGDADDFARSSMAPMACSPRLQKQESFVSALSSKSSRVTGKIRRDDERSSIQHWLNMQLTVPPDFEERPMDMGRLRRLVEGWPFSVASGVLICTNAIYVGVYAEFTLQNEFKRISGLPFEEPWWIFVHVFDLFFFLEIMIRLCAEHKEFYWGKNALWNSFDTVVVVMSLSNIFIAGDLSANRGAVPQVSYLRILRLIRVIHTFSVFRLPMFGHLRMISNAMVRTLPVCFWAAMIGAGCLYVSGVAFVLGIAAHYQSMYTGELVADSEIAEEVSMLQTYFASLPFTMLSIYMSVSGGIDWEIVYLSLKGLNDWYKMGFIVLTVFLFFLVVNVVTGMVIERAFKVVKQDRDFWILENAEQSQMYEQRVRGLFHQIDLDASGALTWDEFSDAFNNPHLEAYLSFIELDTVDLFDVFSLLDKDGNDAIEIDEFVDGVHELRGVVHKAQIKQIYNLLLRTISELTRSQPRSSAARGLRVSQLGEAVGMKRPERAIFDPALERSWSSNSGVSYKGGRRVETAVLAHTSERSSASLGVQSCTSTVSFKGGVRAK